MSGHDFKQLSSRDFEELTRDLLLAEWDVALEMFKTGRDNGIDLRCISAAKGTTIVQCKHYAGSGYAKLIAHLRGTELGKVRKLGPSRYVLVTSVELSPANKEAIKQLFQPFVISPNDVVGANDIDGLLQRHPSVARSNFKLWLTSTDTLERVLHDDVACQTEFEVERVIRKLPIFVQNAGYPRAQEILNKTGILVISGVPGIGKTTLAEILLYAHLEQKYEPIVIQADVREAKKVFNSKRPQVFYFDDFLGQTFLGEGRFPGSLNADVSLVEFVEMVRSTGRSRFILTTREHLLQGARATSERLRHSSLMDSRCLLEIADYSKGQRARILYNHLYFSDLPREYKVEMLRDDFFLEVVGHKHFSPRLIEWISAMSRLRNVRSSDYQSHIRSVLSNPRAIWSHAFNHQISAAARAVLLVLYSLGLSAEVIELESAWRSLNALGVKKYNRQTAATDYLKALKELDNAFVNYRGGRAEFLNPSVREMVGAEICEFPELALDLVASACRFRQLAAILELAEQEDGGRIHQVMSQSETVLHGSMCRLVRTSSFRWDAQKGGRGVGTFVDVVREERLVHVGKAASLLGLPLLRALFESEVHALCRQYEASGCYFKDAMALIEAFDEDPQLKAGRGAALQRELLDAILDKVPIDRAGQINTLIDCGKMLSIWSEVDEAKLTKALGTYRAVGCDAECDGCEDAAGLERLKDDLMMLGDKTGVHFSREVESLDRRTAEFVAREPDRAGNGSWRGTGTVADGEADTDDSIREVFGSLLE